MIGEAELDRLLHFRAREALVLSVYVTFRPEEGLRGIRTRLHALLKPVQELADSDQLSHAARLSLRADLERIHEIAEPLDLAWKGEQKELDERAKRGGRRRFRDSAGRCWGGRSPCSPAIRRACTSGAS